MDGISGYSQVCSTGKLPYIFQNIGTKSKIPNTEILTKTANISSPCKNQV